MGLLEDAIREHLDLKRARGADPREIERLEKEALGPVRREPVAGSEHADGFAEEHASGGHSPIEYHDSTAPNWQQDEDFGDHHPGGEAIEMDDPGQHRRRGFLRRSRGHAAGDHGAGMEHGNGLAGEGDHWPEQDLPDGDFDLSHLDEIPVAYDEPPGLIAGTTGPPPGEHGVDVAFDDPFASGGPPGPTPQRGIAEPDYGPPAELHRMPEAPGQEAPAPADGVWNEPALPTAAAAGTQHPILEDLPAEFTAGGLAGLSEGDAIETPAPRPDEVEPQAAGPQPRSARPEPEPAEAEPDPADAEARSEIVPTAPEPGPQSGEVGSAPAGPSEPPPLQFESPPKRPSESTSAGGGRGGAGGRGGRGGGDGGGESQHEHAGMDYEPLRMFDMDGGATDESVGETIGEDVLEETPEFLQDTPEHDRLWFEQRPPKDFDFDG